MPCENEGTCWRTCFEPRWPLCSRLFMVFATAALETVAAGHGRRPERQGRSRGNAQRGQGSCMGQRCLASLAAAFVLGKTVAATRVVSGGLRGEGGLRHVAGGR